MRAQVPATSTTAPTTGRSASAPPRPVPRWWNPVALGLPLAALLVLGFGERWITDDGLIYIRSVRQIIAGNGPVYNVGERAESATGTLWQWLVAAVSWATGAQPGPVAVYAGLVLTVAGFGLALWGTAVWHQRHGERLRLVPAGVLVPLALPPVWDFATSGLENGLSYLWLGGCWLLLVRARLRRAAGGVGGRARERLGAVGAAVAMGLGVMVRPDLGVPSVVFLVALVALRWRGPVRAVRGWLRALGLVGAAVVVPGGYELFRAGYYGVLVPLPALAKEAGAAQWGRGWSYVADFVGPYALWVPLVGVAVLLVSAGVGAGRADRVVVAAPVVAAALLVGYVVRVGGDYMHARMLLVPLFLVVLPVLVVPWSRRNLVVGGAVLVWFAVCVGPARNPAGGSWTANVHADDQRLTGTAHPTTGAAWAQRFPGMPDAVRAAVAAGRRVLLYYPDGSDKRGPMLAVPLAPDAPGGPVAVEAGYLGVTGAVVPLDDTGADIYGLADPLGAHLAYRRGVWPGHEKLLPDVWLFALYADPAAGVPPRADRSVTPAALAAARHALTCGPVRTMLDAARQPMSWGRFWTNVGSAWDNTRLRVPRDPFAAEREFCGS